MKVGIIGAGPAGLFTAWLLRRKGLSITVFEAQPYVGGISRSFLWHGFTCDLGAHRLFTEDEEILRYFLSLVPMGRHIRRSRLYLAGKWLHDPVNIAEILYRYSPDIKMRIILSYLSRPHHISEITFDDFVHKRYGSFLNRFFFRPYTEKLFDLSGDQISADWARQKVRIATPWDRLRENSRRRFSYFYYPIQGGYGSIVQRIYQDVQECVLLNAPVLGLKVSDRHIDEVVYEHEGQIKRESFDVIISTVPLDILGKLLGCDFLLTYRGAYFVYLLINRPLVSDNHWLYFIDKNIVINRLVEFKNLSPLGQPQEKTVLCAEVTSAGNDVVQRVCNDLVRCGLIREQDILDTMLLYERYAYPVFNVGYSEHLSRVRKAIERFDNLYLVGRFAQFQHLELDEVFVHSSRLVSELTASLTTVGGKAMEKEIAAGKPAGMPAVYAVVLAFNHYSDTRECLLSLQNSDYENLSIVVVDNGSSDGTPDKVREEFPGVHLIETGRNLGVPWGFNVGFRYALNAGAEYILMLNNDTVVDSRMVSSLVAVGQLNPDAGILVPKILYYDRPNVIWAVGGRYRTFPPAHVIIGQNHSSSDFTKPGYLEYALSCGLLIHRRAFERAGLFDPGYFFFFDDWDFSHRVRAHGLKIIYVPEARMWHKVSKTTRQSGQEALFWKVWGESATRFYRRHGNPPLLSVFIHVGFIMLREALKGNLPMLKWFWAGVQEGMKKPLGSIPRINDHIL